MFTIWALERRTCSRFRYLFFCFIDSEEKEDEACSLFVFWPLLVVQPRSFFQQTEITRLQMFKISALLPLACELSMIQCLSSGFNGQSRLHLSNHLSLGYPVTQLASLPQADPAHLFSYCCRRDKTNLDVASTCKLYTTDQRDSNWSTNGLTDNGRIATTICFPHLRCMRLAVAVMWSSPLSFPVKKKKRFNSLSADNLHNDGFAVGNTLLLGPEGAKLRFWLRFLFFVFGRVEGWCACVTACHK